ncbi:DUF1656 domain-containing protein [Swingsia samuiensis]|uniref:DUF1656 domain-containing protein n=1 Tax=Swingsia samuiensis TaxID=1293412 RepID=A0A4Y6UM54_9PROT|nr:DUF1656 domain-containing protein [Swingsia samuiensis]
MVIRQVIDIDGLLVSAFVIDVALSLMTLGLVRWLFGVLNLWRYVWNPPLAQFGLLVCFLGIYTLFL